MMRKLTTAVLLIVSSAASLIVNTEFGKSWQPHGDHYHHMEITCCEHLQVQ
jgi:hypothetical protein